MPALPQASVVRRNSRCMIFDNPKDWQDLQDNVCTVLNQVGFEASTSKIIKTPRGQVEVDVYATDPFSIDRIIYIVECKNWENKVPQTVIHSFTTVMQETGANVGYIISKVGFQKGAFDYIQNTSIKNFTFVQFQEKYLRAWAGNYFNNEIHKAADSLIQYTEPINSRRERYIDGLPQTAKKAIRLLMERYSLFASILLFQGSQNLNGLTPGVQLFNEVRDLNEIEQFKNMLRQYSGFTFTSTCYTDLLKELRVVVERITEEFKVFFGKDIFKE